MVGFHGFVGWEHHKTVSWPKDPVYASPAVGRLWPSDDDDDDDLTSDEADPWSDNQADWQSDSSLPVYRTLTFIQPNKSRLHETRNIQ